MYLPGSGDLKVRIADIVISVASVDSPGTRLGVEEAYKYFLADGEPRSVLRVHEVTKIPHYYFEKMIFNSGSIWRVYGGQNKYFLHLFYQDPPEERLAVFDYNFGCGDIYIRKKTPRHNRLFNPLEYPLDELLMVNLLSLERGVMVHACGISKHGGGVIFAGPSGAGKSTIANLWKDKEGVAVLNDDRIIIREIDGCFWMYGTPWHGGAKLFSPEGVPLEKILFIKHAPKNILTRLGRLEAISRLLVCSFLPFWDPSEMECSLRFCDELSQKTPCYELGFVPEEDALDFV